MKKIITDKSRVFPWNIHPIQLYLLAQNYGICPDLLHTRLGLAPEQLADLSLKISWQQYRAMMLLVEQQGPDDWPFALGKRLTQPVYGLLSLAIKSCENWRQALNLLIEFKPLMTSLFELKLTETEDYLLVDVLPELSRDPLQVKMTQVLMLVFYKVFCSISEFEQEKLDTRGKIQMYLRGPAPCYQQAMSEYLQGAVQFEYPVNFIRIDKSLVDKTLKFADPVTARSIATLMTTQLDQLPVVSGILNRLRTLFAQGFYQQQQCANQLNTSVATLKRKLSQANTQFNQELAQYRLLQACHMLRFTPMTIDSIADGLGFQDTGSLRRLFKGHTGMTPADFRLKNQSQADTMSQ